MTGPASGGFRRVARRRLSSWSAFALDEVDIVAPGGACFTRRYFHSPGVVAIVALDESTPEPAVALVRQYRPAHDRWFWEIPAGTRDVEGESALECARRELAEESGLEADDWSELLSIAPATGSANTVVHLWLARGLRCVDARPEGEEEAAMERSLVPLGEVWPLLTSDPPVNATTALGIRLAVARVPGLDRWLG